MTGKHYGWHRRWTVDLLAASAIHESGLVARFLALPLTEAQTLEHEADAAIGKCWTPDGREWGIVTTSAMLKATFEALKSGYPYLVIETEWLELTTVKKNVAIRD